MVGMLNKNTSSSSSLNFKSSRTRVNNTRVILEFFSSYSRVFLELFSSLSRVFLELFSSFLFSTTRHAEYLETVFDNII